MTSNTDVPSPPPERGIFSRPSFARASADAIPILVDGQYHLFHLTTPPYTRHHPPRLRSSWWRMRSQDLVNWTRDHEPCISPSNDLAAPDADGAWTGAAILDLEGKLNIFYTGYNLSRKGKQVILRSRSASRTGDEFDCPGKAISVESQDRDMLEDIDFRDPYVFWNASESRYWMLIASRLAKGPHWSRGCIALLTSPDLQNWFMSEKPLYTPNDIFCAECPELFTLGNGKWYLVYSRFHAPNAGTVYRIADSPYGPFRMPRDGSQGRLDGRRWYAAKSCPKTGDPSKRIYFGWIADYVDDEHKWLWGGDLAIPREVTADKRGHLYLKPVADLINKFEASGERLALPSETSLVSVGSTAVMPIEHLPAHDDLLLHVSVQDLNAHAFGFGFNMGEESKGYRMHFAKTANSYTATLLTDFPPLDDFWADQYRLHLPRSVDGPELVRHEHVRLDQGITLLLRGGLLEAFFGGRSITYRLPLSDAALRQDTIRVSLFVEDGSIQLNNWIVYAKGVVAEVDSL